MPSHGLNPIENVYVVATAADLPDVLSRFIIYHLLYDPGDGVGLYYSDDESTLTPVSSAAAEINDLTVAVTWANVPVANIPNLNTSKINTGTFVNARISVGSVTQHEAALTILEGQITDGSIFPRLDSSETISLPNGGSWLFTSDGSGQVFLDLGTDLKLGANDGSTDVFFNHNNSDFRIGVTGTRFNAIPMLFDGFNGLRSGQPIYISEQASSNANVTAWGQLWIKSDAPNTLWFTGDTGVERPVGHNVLPYIALTSAYTLLLVDNGERLNRTNTTSFDVTCPDLSTLPVGATYIFTNQGASGTFRVKGATGVTLRHFTGSAVDSVTAGNGFVIATGGIVTVNKVTDTEYHIWGSGITTA